MNATALLRAPPFPGLTDAPPGAAPASPVPEGPARAALFDQLRAGRVGGRFWAEPARLDQPPGTVFRPRLGDDLSGLAALAEGRSALWVFREASQRARLAQDATQSCGDVDPWSVLPGASALVAHGDDEWVAIARLAGVPAIHILSPGRFGQPGASGAALDACVAQALAVPMRDPFGDGWLAPEQAVALLADWRRVIDGNRGPAGAAIVAVCGMAWWKRAEIRRFLWLPDTRLRIFRSARRALAFAQAQGGALAIWPSRVSPTLLAEARSKGVPLVLVEDGFVRSVGLGSDLVPPASIVVDRQGMHFDPSGPSALEDILAHTRFAPDLLARARRLAQTIVAAGISKYAGGHSDGADDPLPQRIAGGRLVLVPGQVENDMSVLAGGGGLASNLELLRRVRALEPEAEIWWRPHPDVDAGHRKGAVADDAALAHADRIVRGGSIAPLLEMADAVHVLTSLTGFEALLRGCEVTCHGTPFYAGWGLTRDLGPVPGRRGRALLLDELVAGVLILYPRYLDPVTGLPCSPELLVERMAQDRIVNRQGWIGPVRRLQGRLMARIRLWGRAQA